VSSSGAGPGRRRALLAVVAVVLVAAVAGGLALGGVFDGGGGGSGSGSDHGAGSRTAAQAADDITLAAGPTSVEAPLLFTKFPDGVADQVMAALTKYVDAGIVTALRKGKADDAALGTVVDAGVTAQLAGADRSVLLDEGLPRAVGRLTVTAPAIPITALVGADGRALVVIATVRLDETAKTGRGAVHITRNGDLQFAPDAAGTWKLSGYDLTVNRDGRAVPGGAEQTSGGTTTTTRRKGSG